VLSIWGALLRRIALLRCALYQRISLQISDSQFVLKCNTARTFGFSTLLDSNTARTFGFSTLLDTRQGRQCSDMGIVTGISSNEPWAHAAIADAVRVLNVGSPAHLANPASTEAVGLFITVDRVLP
jgi:hypothetical protein